MTGTGNYQIIPADSGINALTAQIKKQLLDLSNYAWETGREFDPAAIRVETKRITSGRIGVNVEADLVAPPPTTDENTTPIEQDETEEKAS